MDVLNQVIFWLSILLVLVKVNPLHSPPFSQDLGLQGTSLNEILYKNAAFLNLVDPISHELLLSLARDLQCPKRVRIQKDPL